jgi:hypothetical protein
MFGGAMARVAQAGVIAIFALSSGVQGQAPEHEPSLRVTSDSVHGEIIVELPPLSLPAHTSHHAAHQPPALAMVVPVTGWIYGYSGEMVDSAGRAIPIRLLHHVNLIVPQRRELFSTIMQRMGAAGAETPPVELPSIFGRPLLGYPVTSGDTLLLTAMVHNPTDQSYEGARVRVRMLYAPANTWPRPMSIYPFYLDVMPPAGVHAYDLPAGHSQKSWQGRPAVAGRILAVGGHLHKYGVALRFEDVTAGRLLWQTTPVTDSAGDVIGVPTKTFWWRLGIPVRPDHEYRLTAVYDNPTGHAIPDGAMGALGGVIVPNHMSAWPVVDRLSAEYQHDVRVTYDTTMTDMDMPGMDDESPGSVGDAHAGNHASVHAAIATSGNPPRRPAQTP